MPPMTLKPTLGYTSYTEGLRYHVAVAHFVHRTAEKTGVEYRKMTDIKIEGKEKYERSWLVWYRHWCRDRHKTPIDARTVRVLTFLKSYSGQDIDALTNADKMTRHFCRRVSPVGGSFFVGENNFPIKKPPEGGLSSLSL